LKTVLNATCQNIRKGDENEIEMKLVDRGSKDGSVGAGDKL